MSSGIARLILALLIAATLLCLGRVLQLGPSILRIAQVVLCGLLVASFTAHARGARHGLVAVLVCLLALAWSGMVQFGLAAPSILLLAGSGLAIAVYVGPAQSRLFLATQVLLLGVLGIAFGTGAITPVIDLDQMNANPLNWLALAVAFLILSFLYIFLADDIRRSWDEIGDTLRRRQEQLETLVRHSSEGIAIQDVDAGHFVALNPKAELLLGVSSEEIVGRKGLVDFSAAQSFDGRPPAEVVQAMLTEALEGGTPRFEWVLRASDDEEMRCEMHFIRLPDESRRLVRIAFVDISEQKAAGEMRDLVAVLFQSSAEGMILCDRTGAIQSANPAIATDTGHSLSELSETGLGDLLAGDNRVALLKAISVSSVEAGDDNGPCWNGDVEFRRKDGTSYPTWTIVNALRDASGQTTRFIVLVRNLSELQKANEEILRQAERDFLTGLPNRLSLIRRIAAILAEIPSPSEQARERLALVFVDIDELKQVNDRYGHSTGDAVLRQLARRLERRVPASDVLARHSGDEFALLLTDPEAGSRARRVAMEMRDEIARPFLVERGSVQLTASIGLALFPEDAQDAMGLVGAADQALFEAKTGGGSRVVSFTPEIGRRARDRLCLMDELQVGMEREELRLLYQPVVELRTGRLAKVEALVRWQHPELGLLGPDRFIPLAEDARMIDSIGDWVLKQCTADLPPMRVRFGDDFQASINVSPLQLATGGAERFESWKRRIARVAQDGRSLILEITESALLDPDPEMVARLDAFRSAGAQVALDDFGAGHTSLLYYLTHDFDFLKIDREFIRNAPQDPRARALCQTILGFSHRLGAAAIAEGVETAAQVEMLREAECQLAQGFFFSPPLPLEELLELPERFALP